MRLLDLFCGAGGAAMGYHRAGFTEIVGVDIAPQPRYPFEFVQADSLQYLAKHGGAFDVIHASPPCQGYSRCRFLPQNRKIDYPLMIEDTRRLLRGIDAVYVIENVEYAPHGFVSVYGDRFSVPVAQKAMYIDWMTRKELAQAIPPAYTEYIGAQLKRIILTQK